MWDNIYHLKLKNILGIVLVKKGNNGWRIFEIQKNIFDEIPKAILLEKHRRTADTISDLVSSSTG